MARLGKRILGSPSGKLGDMVFRNMNNSTFIATAPVNINVPMDADSVNRRSKFRFVVKLSAAVSRLFSLNFFWKKSASGSRSGFNQMFASNYDNIGTDLDVTKVELTADPEFIVASPEIVIAAGSVTLNADPLGAQSGWTPDVTDKIAAQGVLCLSNPIDSENAPYRFVSLSSPDQDVDLIDPLVFVCPIGGVDSNSIALYQNKKVLLTLVTKDSEGNPVNSSVTFSN